MNRNLGFLLATALTGCASTPGSSSDAHDGVPSTICRIMELKQDYLGRTVRINAHINTDLRHFTYLQDESCGERNMLDIGRARGNSEYEELRTSWTVICEKRGSAGLCVIEEQVAVIGTIRRSDQGHLVIDISSIRRSHSGGSGKAE